MHGLRTVVFDVADLASAKRFYADVLGHEPYFDEPFYVGFDVEGYELGLRPGEGARQPGVGGATAYFGVDDVDRAVARLVERGAKVREAAQEVGEGIIVASVIDPFGNVLGLIRNLHFAPELVAAKAGDVSERAIVHERVVALPRREVWSLWTTTEGITRWLVDEAKIELRPGGAYEVYFLLDQPIGARGSETCRVLSFVPERMVSFTWNAPPHLATRFLHTWVVVELEDAGEGRTRVRVTHTGWPETKLREDPAWEETYRYFDPAWARVVDRLATFAETGKKA